MGFRLAEAFVEFSSRGVSTLNRGIDGIKTRTAAAASSLRSMSGAAATLGVGFSIKSLLGASLEEFAEGVRASQRLDAVLLATGNTTRFTRQQLDDMAGSLAMVSRFEDDQVQEAQALLATYRNISGEAFPRTLKAAADIAELFGGDLTAATEALGAALDKPAESLGRLRAANIKFTDAQQETITKMAEAGDLAGAQAEIFNELERFSGLSAQALEGQTGAVIKLDKAWSDLKETLGQAIAQPVAPWLEEITKGLEGLPWAVENAGGLSKALWQKIQVDYAQFSLDLTGGMTDMLGIENKWRARLGRLQGNLDSTLRGVHDRASGPSMPTAAPGTPGAGPASRFGPEPDWRMPGWHGGLELPDAIEIKKAEIKEASFQTFAVADFSRALQEGIRGDAKKEEKEIAKNTDEQKNLHKITNEVLMAIRDRSGLAVFAKGH